MTPNHLERPRHLSCLLFLSAVILFTLSHCQFLCLSVLCVTNVHSYSVSEFIPLHVCLQVLGMFPANLIVSLQEQTPAIAHSSRDPFTSKRYHTHVH